MDHGADRERKVFYQYLFMKYVDGNIKNTNGHQLLENGNGINIPKAPAQSGYGKEWERVMIQGTGDRLKVIKVNSLTLFTHVTQNKNDHIKLKADNTDRNDNCR